MLVGDQVIRNKNPVFFSDAPYINLTYLNWQDKNSTLISGMCLNEVREDPDMKKVH